MTPRRKPARNRLRKAETCPAWDSLRTGVAILTFAFLILAGCGEGNAQPAPAATAVPETQNPTVQLQPLGGAPIEVQVEVVATPQGRARGLMFRESLPAGTGMLFIFPETRILSFWMRNTPISLDIIFIDPSGTIVNIHPDTIPYSEKSLPSTRPARFVLEVPGGYCAQVGIRAGDRIELGALANTPAT